MNTKRSHNETPENCHETPENYETPENCHDTPLISIILFLQAAPKPASRKSILKSQSAPRLSSVGAAHFAEDLPTYSPSGSPGKSRLGLPRYSTASPLHINDVTCSKTPAPIRPQPRPKKQVKISEWIL